MDRADAPRDPWSRRHWVFDLDGTLTVAVHDFDALRRRLGLPFGVPVLDAARGRPEILEEIERWEWELAESAVEAPGAIQLIRRVSRGRVGILTRNRRDIALRTIEVAGLPLDTQFVLGRDEAEPKPSPDGILRLLRAWNADPRDAVMVGDFRFDIEAGRAAGVFTIHVTKEEPSPEADCIVPDLVALLETSPSV